MRTPRTLLGLVVAAGGLVVAGASPAAACECVEAGPARQLRWADAVFVGRVTRIDEGVRRGTTTRYTLEVARVLHGGAHVRPVVTVASAADPAACGLDGLRLGEDYVVFAGAGREALGANRCGGTAPATTTLEHTVTVEVGHGARAVVAASIVAGGVLAGIG